MHRGRRHVRAIAISAAIVSAVVPIGARSTAVAQSAEPLWLTITNRYRAVAGLDPVTEDPQASTGATLHSVYLVRNHQLGHDEDKRLPGYSKEGRRAGLTGNVAAGSGSTLNERSAVEGWMTAPFHGIGMLAPDAKRFGYGQARAHSGWAATLPLFWELDPDADATVGLPDVEALIASIRAKDPTVSADAGYSYRSNGRRAAIALGGRTFLVDGDVIIEVQGGLSLEATLRTAASPGRRSMVWPGDGTGVPLVRYSGNESPDPLTSCQGYRSAGLPIYLARGRATEVGAATVTDDRGQSIPLCILSAMTYRGRGDDEQRGRGLLDSYGAVVLLPKTTLEFGHEYHVDVTTTDGEHVAWSFRTTVDEIVPAAGNPLADAPTPGRSSQRPGAPRRR